MFVPPTPTLRPKTGPTDPNRPYIALGLDCGRFGFCSPGKCNSAQAPWGQASVQLKGTRRTVQCRVVAIDLLDWSLCHQPRQSRPPSHERLAKPWPLCHKSRQMCHTQQRACHGSLRMVPGIKLRVRRPHWGSSPNCDVPFGAFAEAHKGPIHVQLRGHGLCCADYSPLGKGGGVGPPTDAPLF